MGTVSNELSEHNETALKDYLASFDLFKDIEQEGANYINYAMHRFMITLEMVPPAVGSENKLLELGANPYFITLLLRRFRNYRITCANYFGKDGPSEGRGKQVISSAKYDEQHEFSYDHFNIEKDPYPYADDYFDIVLFCEILEHLPTDPTQSLYEIHRVLKPGGYMLLTTPNVLAWQNFWRLAIGQNIYDQYSGYGVYGRHNREYAPIEVIRLLQACGFEVVKVRLEDLHSHPWPLRILKRIRQHWRDNIFVLARAQGSPRYGYPDSLYRSMHGVLRIVSSEIIMGENDQVQLGEGWFPLEPQLMARWTGKEAWAYLSRQKDESALGLVVNAMAKTLGETTLSVEVGSALEEFVLSKDKWQEFKVPLPNDFDENNVKIKLTTIPTRKPSAAGYTSDDRELGILIKRIWLL
jgi:SAM-dependent methyltransferase